MPKAGTISFKVVDSVTRLPIGGADVSIFDLSTRGLRALATNPAGVVEFANFLPGRYSLFSINAKGYTFDIAAHRDPIVLLAGDRLTFGPLAVDPLGAMSGTVVDGDGKPVVGATVEVLVPGPTTLLMRTDATNAEGKYKFAGIQAGRFLVRLLANARLGIPATYYPNVERAEQAVRVNVPPGREADRIDFTVRRMAAFHIRGTVDGAASGAGTAVTLRPCDTGGTVFVRTYSVPVREDGSFDTEVMPGEHCLELRPVSRGSEPMTSFARVRLLVTDRDVDNARLIPAAAQELIGTVKLEKDAGLSMPPFVSFLPIDIGMSQPEPGQVQTDGSFRIGGVFAVDYRVYMADGGGYIKSVKLGGVEMNDGRVNMESGGGPLVIEIAPARGRAKVKVNLGAAKPAQILVVLMPTKSAGMRSDVMKVAPASDQGELTLERIAPGVYKAYAFADPIADLVKMPEFLDLFQASTVRIVDSEEPNIELRLIPRREFDEAKGRF